MATLGTGTYTYTAVMDWAKLPPGETFAMVSAIATDSQGPSVRLSTERPSRS